MLVYAYGAKAPLNPEPVLEQILLAHRYQNKLVEIERERRAARDAYMATVLPPEKLAREAELQALIDGAFTTVRNDRQKTRARVKMDATQRETVKGWKAELKALRAELKAIRAEVREAERTREDSPLAVIGSTAAAAVRAARAACGVFWGTYLLVERAMDLAAKSPTPPRFHRFDGAGQIGVQLQGAVDGYHRAGLPVESLTGDTRLQVLTMDATDWRPGGPNPNLSHWRLLRIRIGSEGRAPIWAEVPFRLHRPLPPGSVITWATVQRKRIGTTFRWAVQFTVSPSPAPEPRHHAPDAVCGIDIGWRKMDEGLRVAIAGTYEGVEECILPHRVVDRFEKSDDIRHIRDKNFNAAVSEIVKCRDAWPDWMREMCEHISRWRAPAKLAMVVLRWRENRFIGDELAFPILSAWRAQDRHLLEMESHIRLRGLNSRKDCYRKFSVDICRRFGIVSVQGFALDECAQLPEEDEEESPLHQEARKNRTRAATSELRLALKHASRKTGTELVCH